MAYTKPHYLVDQEIDDPDLDYVWDDTRTGDDFENDGEWLPEKLQKVYLTGQIALGIGIYEWIVWRFQPLSNDPEPVQLAEAAWCATVHPAYMDFAAFDRYSWMGPIRGPLWCAQTWLVPMARSDRDSADECEGLDFLYCLAMHVLPNTTTFEAWLAGCVDRLLELYQAPEEDPYARLFTDPTEGRGPLVSPSLVDLNEPYDPSRRESMSRLLVAAQQSANPFLNSSAEMRKSGFAGTPYEISNPDLE